MVYKHHANLKEMILADAHQKVMDGIFDITTAPKICNCWNIQKINGNCVYKGKCNTYIQLKFLKVD